jgi:hypothetical protein
VDVVPRTRDATRHLDRISGPACDEDSGQELTGGKDDCVFRLVGSTTPRARECSLDEGHGEVIE